jgi:catechol 2,3-dioxygenase-like lactoylglutathione lyase family enzyme
VAIDHLAIPVRDQERSRRFSETYLGFGAEPARRYDDGVLMLYNAAGFALALGRTDDPIARARRDRRRRCRRSPPRCGASRPGPRDPSQSSLHRRWR